MVVTTILKVFIKLTFAEKCARLLAISSLTWSHTLRPASTASSTSSTCMQISSQACSCSWNWSRLDLPHWALCHIDPPYLGREPAVAEGGVSEAVLVKMVAHHWWVPRRPDLSSSAAASHLGGWWKVYHRLHVRGMQWWKKTHTVPRAAARAHQLCGSSILSWQKCQQWPGWQCFLSKLLPNTSPFCDK